MLGKLVNKFKKQSLQDQQLQLSANILTDDINSSNKLQIDLFASSSSSSLPSSSTIISKKFSKSGLACQNSTELDQNKRVLRKSARLNRNNSNVSYIFE